MPLFNRLLSKKLPSLLKSVKHRTVSCRCGEKPWNKAVKLSITKRKATEREKVRLLLKLFRLISRYRKPLIRIEVTTSTRSHSITVELRFSYVKIITITISANSSNGTGVCTNWMCESWSFYSVSYSGLCKFYENSVPRLLGVNKLFEEYTATSFLLTFLLMFGSLFVVIVAVRSHSLFLDKNSIRLDSLVLHSVHYL